MTALYVVAAFLILLVVLACLGLICCTCGEMATVRRGKARFCRGCGSFRGFVR